MKKSELKNLVREILSEQIGVAPNPFTQSAGHSTGGGTRPPLPTAPVGGQTQATGGSQTGGVTPTSGPATSAETAQIQALLTYAKNAQSKRIQLPSWFWEIIRIIKSSGTIQI